MYTEKKETDKESMRIIKPLGGTFSLLSTRISQEGEEPDSSKTLAVDRAQTTIGMYAVFQGPSFFSSRMSATEEAPSIHRSRGFPFTVFIILEVF